MWRRRRLVQFGYAVALLTIVALIVLVPPQVGPLWWIGSRTERATMIQAWLTGAAILVSLVAVLWELGTVPALRISFDSGPGAGKVHFRLRAQAHERPIQGLRIEVRLPEEYPLDGPDRLEVERAEGWRPVYRYADDGTFVLGWDLVKSRLELRRLQS